MSIRVEVTCPEAGDATVGLCGEDPVLGGWEQNKAVRLARSGEVFTGEIQMLPGGSQFKLLIIGGGDSTWEPLLDNRRWPSSGLGIGALLRMTFGQSKIGIEASAEQIEANAKATRKLEDRAGSALQEDVDRKGDNAYYYAHNRKFEVPPDAKVITGPGLITGGAPVLLEAGADMVDAREEDRTVYLKDYSWADSNGKVKVYVPVPEGLLPAEGADGIVDCKYAATQVDLTISSKPRQKLKIEKLNAELKIDACTTRVEAHKNRIVLNLAKKRETSWYSLTKK
mmetsp:Transcript_31977/g.68078  ORF Transcript_31977/g.68078 Transcript_31977/m.68078 type:complete len:283 (-) Transcript_31977:38-886(-)